jgi:phage protein U
MKIGNWGSGLKFQTSDSRVLTFQRMTRNLSVNTNKHKVLGGKKPRLEFVGPDLQTVSFTMELNALLCKRPRKVEETLFQRASNGNHYPLVIGGRVILKQAIITKISSSYDVVLKKGEIYSMKIDVTMSEYN